jgi:hypothetical protein
MNHLGERVSSLVDGQLGIVAVERAMSHVAGCRECRDAVELERLTKQRLAMLTMPSPADNLMHQLMEMAGPSGPLPPRSGHVPGSPRPQLISTSVGFVGDPVARSITVGIRPPTRRGSSRPPVSARSKRPTTELSRVARVTRSSRNRVAAAMVGAACLVGAGVAGGVATSGAASATVVPPVDSFVVEHIATARNLPLSDQTVMWGTVGAGR